jgi:hypothetical protein
MHTRPVIAASARRVATVGALAVVAALIVSGMAIGSDADGPIDPSLQAAWLEEHFRCEHQAEMDAEMLAGGPIDPAVQAAWLEDHFRCEHQADTAEA